MHHAILTIKSLSNGKFGSTFKPVLFALLLWAASAAGEIPVPGTPVPITLQTFVIMLAALMLPWRQAGAAIALYLAAGASDCRYSPVAPPLWRWSDRAPDSCSDSCPPPSSPLCSRAKRAPTRPKAAC